MTGQSKQHWCTDISNFPLDKYFQKGEGRGTKILFIGESPAENGWIKSGKACYSPEGKLLATGARLDELLKDFGLSTATCGFTELSKCFLGNNRKKLDECCRKCWPILIKQLSEEKHQLIITLGVITAKIFGELIGKELIIGEMVSSDLAGRTRNILPIYHPSPANPWGREKNKKIFEKNRCEIERLLGD